MVFRSILLEPYGNLGRDLALQNLAERLGSAGVQLPVPCPVFALSFRNLCPYLARTIAQTRVDETAPPPAPQGVCGWGEGDGKLGGGGLGWAG